MNKSLGNILVFVLVIAMIMNGAVNIQAIGMTVIKFFSGGLNAVVGEDKQIIINVPDSQAPERGYRP